MRRSRLPRALDQGQRLGGVMGKARRGLLMPPRQPDPELHAVNARALGARRGRRALGMDDAAPGRHPVDRAGADRLDAAEAVAVQDLAVEEIGHRRQPDMRMRPHVQPLARAEFRRPEMIEEDERPEGAAFGEGQHAPHCEAVAQIADARQDHHLERRRGTPPRRSAPWPEASSSPSLSRRGFLTQTKPIRPPPPAGAAHGHHPRPHHRSRPRQRGIGALLRPDFRPRL